MHDVPSSTFDPASSIIQNKINIGVPLNFLEQHSNQSNLNQSTKNIRI